MITRGLESASKGMSALIEYEDVIANNIANVNTVGFKRTNIAFKNLMEARVEETPNLAKAESKYRTVGSLSLGSGVDRTYLDFSQGPLNQTGNKLDVGIKGEGFFKVRNASSINNPAQNEGDFYYSRGGNFHMTQDYYLVNENGDYIMDRNDQRIRITRDPNNPDNGPDNKIDPIRDLAINEKGTLQLTNPLFARDLQTIAIFDFNNKSQITSLGEGKYAPIAGQDAQPYLKQRDVSLHQGTIEGSNSNTVIEMIQSINVSRTYETLAKLVKTQGETLSQAIELGKIKG